MLLKSDLSSQLASDLATRLAEARDALTGQMATLGLRASDGWGIREEIRSDDSGTRIILRPMHPHLDAPNIEATVAVGEDGRATG